MSCINPRFQMISSQQVYTHTILINAGSKYVLHLLDSLYNYRTMTGNTISEFTHSNWITLSHYLSPKHKSLFPKCLKHFSHFCRLYFRARVGNINRKLLVHSNLNHTTILVTNQAMLFLILACTLNWTKLV